MNRILLFLLTALLAFGLASQATAQSPTGQLTIIQDTNPESSDVEFDYDFDPGSDFDLEDDQSITKTLAPGTYSIQQLPPLGWKIDSFYCNSDIIYSFWANSNLLEIEVREGDVLECTFVNVRIPPTPTPLPTATPKPPEIVFVPQVIFVQPPPLPAPVIQQVVAPVATVKPAAIAPPKTGDGGVR